MELKSFSKSVVINNKNSNFIDDSIKLENFDRISKDKVLKRKNNIPAKEPFPHLGLNKKLTNVIKEVDEEEEGNEIKRKNSNDIDSKQFKRFIMKKKTQIFQEETIRKPAKSVMFQRIKTINDFFTDCIFLDKNKTPYNCKLYIDNEYQVSVYGDMTKPFYFNNNYYSFPLLYISRCANNSSVFGSNKYCKEITLKDNRNFIFKFPPKTFDEFNEIIDTFALPEKNKYYFNYAYSYFQKENHSMKESNLKIYKFSKEFKRQDIDFSTEKKLRILNNSDFKYCETYPKKLIVPYHMSDEDMVKSADFRTKNRMPTLTYRYKKNKCCIWRSSQTKGGFSGGINESDVKLLTQIADTKKLFIYDARPYLSAYANKLKGAGFENVNNYKDIELELIFCGMSNIHAVRSSFQKITNNVSYLTNCESTNFINITNSGWYEAIIILLKSSFQIYNSIREGNNVLIHCSDGWDRTSQLCSTSQLLLDKYYRTLDGFICLIEKDWISFGHQFRYRSGFYSPVDSNVGENQFSPIFLQWLDAVYQLMCQNYTKFQFNFNLISFLAEEVFTGRYGTFLFNNDKEREEFDENNKTISIWSYIKQNESKFINHIYKEDDYNRGLTINFKQIRLWRDYFYKFEKGNNEYCLEDYDKKLKACETTINKDKEIIEKLSKIIAGKCSSQEIEGFDFECKKYIKKFVK